MGFNSGFKGLTQYDSSHETHFDKRFYWKCHPRTWNFLEF